MLKSVSRRIATVAMGVGLLGLDSCGKPAMQMGERSEIAFAVLSVEPSQHLDRLWAPLFADMEKQTGLKVKPLYASSYADLIEAMRFDKVQAGWFSNASGLEAMKQANGEVFVHTTYPDGDEGYHSVIIVPKASTQTVDRLLTCDHTLNFGTGDAKASDAAAPLTYLFQPSHVDPETCFKTVHSNSYQANMDAVAAGVLDAATNSSAVLGDLGNTPDGEAKLAKIKIIWTSPLLPTDVVEYRSNLDSETKEKLRSFFLSYGQGSGPEADRQRAVLKALNWGPLKPDDNTHFLPERLMEATAALQEAQHRHDDAGIKAAKDEISDVEAEQAALAARTAPQAAADMPSAQASH